MMFLTAIFLVGLTASVDAIPAQLGERALCGANNCVRDILDARYPTRTLDCLSYASIARTSTPTFTFSRAVFAATHITITPPDVTKSITLGETYTITNTAFETSTTVTTIQPANNAKRDNGGLTIPVYASKYCNDFPGEFLSGCSCVMSRYSTTLPAVTPRSTTVTYTITSSYTTILPVQTKIITITPKVTKAVTNTRTVTKTVGTVSTPSPSTFKIKFKNGIHAGKYLFPGPVFDGQEGILYSMFTPEIEPAVNFKINTDTGVITSVDGYNLTWSLDFDDSIVFPPQEPNGPPGLVPSFVFLMSAVAQSVPDYRASPIRCSLIANTDLSCSAGAINERTEIGWYAFGIDEVSYIPTLGLGKPNYDWFSWPGAKVFLEVQWNT